MQVFFPKFFQTYFTETLLLYINKHNIISFLVLWEKSILTRIYQPKQLAYPLLLSVFQVLVQVIVVVFGVRFRVALIPFSSFSLHRCLVRVDFIVTSSESVLCVRFLEKNQYIDNLWARLHYLVKLFMNCIENLQIVINIQKFLTFHVFS